MDYYMDYYLGCGACVVTLATSDPISGEKYYRAVNSVMLHQCFFCFFFFFVFFLAIIIRIIRD